jgi:anti-sigma regulatory factor (Ser/Thr protein kinase)
MAHCGEVDEPAVVSAGIVPFWPPVPRPWSLGGVVDASASSAESRGHGVTDGAPINPLPGARETAQAVDKTAQPGDGLPVALEQTFSRDSLYQLRAAVAAHAGQAGVPPARVIDVVLAVSELAANIIRHGSGQGSVRMWVSEGSLHCQLTDAGPPPAAGAGQAAGPGQTAGPGHEDAAGPAPWPIRHGHGLWVVCRLADQASFESGAPGGATVSFTLGPAHPAGGSSWESANSRRA